MADKFFENNIKYITKIISAGADISGKALDKITKEFVHQFYFRTFSEYSEVQDFTKHYLAANDFLKFLWSRPSNQPRKVRVFNPTVEENGWRSDRTVVECNLDDSPFILDSVLSYLVQHDHILHEVIHPVISVKRDHNGDLLEIIPEDKRGKEQGKLESCMHIQISHISDEKELEKVAKEIDDVLDSVYLSVKDWRKMVEVANNTIKRVESIKKHPFKKAEVEESLEFLKWAANKNFIFLGYRDFNFKKDKTIDVDKNSELGVFKSREFKRHKEKIIGLPFNSDVVLKDMNLVEITKSSRKSLVHRPVHMDYIGIKKFDDKGNVIGEERFIGLFTSTVYFQSAHNIPIIRKKIKEVMDRAGFRSDSHNGKSLAAVLESHPRDELLQSTEDDLFHIGMGIVSLSEKPGTKLFIRKDRFLRFISCIIYIPREFFTTHLRERIQTILEKELNGKVTDYYTQVTDSPMARVNVLVKTVPEGLATDYLHDFNKEFKVPKIDVKRLEQLIIQTTNSWINGLAEKLAARFGDIEGERLFRNYSKSFPEAFKELYHPGGATLDVVKMEEVYKTEKLALDLDLYQLEKDVKDNYQLKLYSLEKRVTLSDILPILENMGFHAIDEITFKIAPKGKDKIVWIHHFRLKVNMEGVNKGFISGDNVPLQSVKNQFEEAFYRTWKGEIENDSISKLIVRAHLSARDVTVLRAYVKYLIQIKFPYSQGFIYSVITKYPELGRLFVKYFYEKFSPDSEKNRDGKVKEIQNKITSALEKVENVTEDRVLRQLFETINATLRTNYFQTDENGNNKTYVSFKINSSKVPNVPKPVPFVEIFVYSNEVEGVHLRGGKVARGGIRWSDRKEDFRTEILGLVKAQMVKNSVIVPVGSKGGFVIRNPITTSRDEYLKQGQECYKIFLSGLLDITDNIVAGKIVKPSQVVCVDGDDPYLVVAADKGTATFSDIANGVAQKYGFWLDDAFASGGSVGYDHKKMGITAKGAWVSVKRHFSEMGRNPEAEEFTAVGVGDMAGDVFGNGLLLSRKYQLVGAFNHLHIFVDPNPIDAEKNFKERERLFNLPRSNWTDYNAKLISKGGGIFERAAKTIPVSKEMKERFGIEENSIAPDDLIKKIITAQVDLLWNGGIGTYVKAESETHEQVGDKANDRLRVNGSELKCKVVGEGGNLGFTQKGRIEYAKIGGRINTDAIDNSGGVDCSDHEVNIKIALRDAVSKKKITLAERNKVLEKMTDEVGRLVLRDNELQTQAITIIENQKNKVIEQNIRLMNYLESHNRLDRAIEYLPTNDELYSRANNKQGLTRPEIAVLLAYSKMYVFDDLISSNLPDDPYFVEDLKIYFPKNMQEKFAKEIESHQLRREIIATFVANSIVNRNGTTFFHRMKEETGLKGCDIARAYTVVRDAFNLRQIWEDIEKASKTVSLQAMMDLYQEVDVLMERACSWFLRNSTHPLNTTKLVKDYQPAVEELSGFLDSIMNKVIRTARDKKYEKFISYGVPKDLAKKIANLEALASACDIVAVSNKTKLPLKIVGEVYFTLGKRLKLGWLRVSARKLMTDSHWDNLAIKAIIDSLFDQQMKLTAKVLSKGCDKNKCEPTITKWITENEKSLSRYDAFIGDLETQDKLTTQMIMVAVQRVDGVLGE
jgi:glutamate dehydrogenase